MKDFVPHGKPTSDFDQALHPLSKMIDFVTRIVRLFAWTVMLVATILVICLLSRNVAEAAGPQQDPRAAAQAIGQAGILSAANIARDPAKTNTVPGYAGTNLPEQNLTDANMAASAHARLANPADPGGAAGRVLAAGAATRPAPPDLSSDPGIARAETIQSAPKNPAHNAGGIASGNASDCPAGVGDANRGGTCGGVNWCVGADCGATRAQGNAGFVRAAASLNMVLEMGGEEFDRQNMAFFPGKRRACQVRLGGLANCCDDKGLLVNLYHCPAPELELARERDAGRTYYLGERCVQRILGECLKRERGWCVFGSKLGRMLHEQARPWLGIDWSSCRGFVVGEIERIDFDRLNLGDFFRELSDPAREPGVVLPEGDVVRAAMQDRVNDLAGGNP